VCFSPDGKQLVAVTRDGTVKTWDPATERATQTLILKGRPGETSVCFSPDGKRLATGGGHFVTLRDAASGQEIFSLLEHASSVRAVCFSPDGKQLASANLDGTVKVWEPATEQAPFILEGCASVCFSPDGKRLASVGKEGKLVKVWDAHTGQALLTLINFDAQVRYHGP
jgi:WD40 repeat protein